MPVGSDFLDLLRVLVDHEVDFIVVGGIAAVLHGSPVVTADVDVLFDAEAANIRKLSAALSQIDAHYFDPAGRRIAPDEGKLQSFRLNLLQTRLGRLDVLRTIGREQTYADLFERTVEFEVDDLRLRVLDLDALIEVKEVAGREKDLYGLTFLRSLRDEVDGG